MAYTNSSLVNYKLLSPNYSSGRLNITRCAIHCVVGQVTAERLGQIFANPNRQASSNYGVALDGRIGMYVEQKNRSWCTSSAWCDNRAITIEVASDAYHPYAVTTAAYNATIKLVADIAKRNGKKKVIWISDKNKNLNYNPASDELLLTAHRFYAAKACPGDYLFARFGDIAEKATAILKEDEEPKITWGVDDYVDGLYKYALTRKHDEAGYKNHCYRLLKGTRTASQTAWAFFGSKQYINKKTSDERFVQQVYEALLRREPDKTGKANRLRELRNGKTRKYVVEYITKSREFKKFCNKRGLKV